MTQNPQKFKVAVILDNNQIKRWQSEALSFCSELIDLRLVLNCQNTHIKRSYRKNFLYYVINALCLKNTYTKSSEFKADSNAEIVNFSSIVNKGWQSFPDEVIALLNNKDLDFIIKFGMNLVVIPDNLNARYGIISYHHGDPTKYRGRPAGFYETMHYQDKVGIIVQHLSNKLDGGDIYVKAFSKIWHYSYKKTATNFYKNSIPLLKKAFLNAQAGNVEINNAEGTNYRLPDNFQAVNFFYLLGKRKLERLLYGLFYEKEWNIAISQNSKSSAMQVMTEKLSTEGMTIPEIAPKYVFYADPFFAPDGSKIYAEALDKTTGLGDIVTLNKTTGQIEKLLLDGAHFSYPQALQFDGSEYLLPEIASFSSPSFVKLVNNNKPEYLPIAGLEAHRLVDATYFEHDGNHYIFGSYSTNSMDNLQLFYSDSRFGPYTAHPKNPIVIDPSCARMAGAIVKTDGKIFRLGQNNSFSYGNKVWLCQIDDLSPVNYAESKRNEIMLANGLCGPHTINFHNQAFVADFYQEKFSIMAGYRRLMKFLKKKQK